MRATSWDLPDDPEVVSKARALAREALISWGLPHLIDDAVLIVSELCTNAVKHGGGAPILLGLRTVGRCLGGEVIDQGATFVPQPRVSDDAEYGRGLHIVGELVDEWGIDPLKDGAGKAVWFKWCW